jgi:EAL domain-containing protein (putative c-di-GMP-specific phosphodiesterase class I)
MKIDKSFVQNVESDRDIAVIVRSIIDLGHNLGLKVTAEGVETREAKDILIDFACDEAQGYYYSHPIPASEVAQFFRELTSNRRQPADPRSHGEAPTPLVAKNPNSITFSSRRP